MACQNGDIAVAQLLLDRGADIDQKGYFTALKAAASYGQPEAIKFLLERGAKIERGSLHLAVRSGKAESVKYLIEGGADVNYQNSDGESPLHWCSCKDSPEIARLLLAGGAAVDVPTRHTKETPLHKAAQRGSIKTVKVLVEAGASITLKGWKGKNAEEWAKAFKRKEVVSFLKSARSQ